MGKSETGDICKYVTSGGTPKSSIKEYYEPKQIPWLKLKKSIIAGSMKQRRIFQKTDWIILAQR